MPQKVVVNKAEAPKVILKQLLSRHAAGLFLAQSSQLAGHQAGGSKVGHEIISGRPRPKEEGRQLDRLSAAPRAAPRLVARPLSSLRCRRSALCLEGSIATC